MTRLHKPLTYVAVILFVCLSAGKVSAQEIRLKDSEHIQTKDWEHLFTIPEHPGLSKHIDSETEDAILAEMNRRQKEVGDTMRTNVLKYGECLDSKMFWHPLRKEVKVFKAWLGVSGISTTEYDEHTKAVDGYLMPDIPIPYVAEEYMTGRDAVLDKLLEMIK